MTHTVTCVPVSMKEKLLVAEVGRHLFFVLVGLCFTIENVAPKRDISFTKERKAADMLNERMISSVPEDEDHHSLILIRFGQNLTLIQFLKVCFKVVHVTHYI